MLPLSRIREFLYHPDADLRLAAARFFHDAHDRGDVTMADWWAAVDTLGLAVVGSSLYYLDDLPDTEATLARFFHELRTGLPARLWFPLCERLARLPFALLEKHIGELRDARHLLAPADLCHAEERFALTSLPPEELWEKLLAHAAECEGEYAGAQDDRLVFRLTEALARHPEFATPRALAILHDAAIKDWREIFAIELAGELRCHEALDALIARLRVDADYMVERARAALVRIGDPGIPARLAADWEHEDWHFRNYASGAIASFRRPENVALLRDLVAREKDTDLQIHMALSLLEMLPDDAATLEAVRQIIVPHPPGSFMEALDQLLATVATMAEWNFPERAAWRADAIAEEERIRHFDDDDQAANETIRAGMLTGLSFLEAGKLVFGSNFSGLEYGEDSADATPALPFVRATPKVGRNDPCPCNSGKKYKKCCGKPA